MVFPGRARQLSQPAVAIDTLFLIGILRSLLCLDKDFDAKFNLPVSGSSFPLPVTAVYIRAVRTWNSEHTQTADYPKAPSWKMYAHYHVYCKCLKVKEYGLPLNRDRKIMWISYKYHLSPFKSEHFFPSAGRHIF